MATTVIGGMLAATVIAIFLIPVTYYVVERFAANRQQRAPARRDRRREQRMQILAVKIFLRDSSLKLGAKRVDLACVTTYP